MIKNVWNHLLENHIFSSGIQLRRRFSKGGPMPTGDGCPIFAGCFAILKLPNLKVVYKTCTNSPNNSPCVFSWFWWTMSSPVRCFGWWFDELLLGVLFMERAWAKAKKQSSHGVLVNPWNIQCPWCFLRGLFHVTNDEYDMPYMDWFDADVTICCFVLSFGRHAFFLHTVVVYWFLWKVWKKHLPHRNWNDLLKKSIDSICWK